MTEKTCVVVDSTADFPKGMIARLGIHMVPVHIIIDGEDYLHGVDLNNQEVIQCLLEKRDVKTDPPLPSEYSWVFEDLSSQYDRIVSFHISRKLSNCYMSAKNSVELLPRDISEKITIIDTRSVTIGQGLIVKRAIEMMKNNKPVEELEKALDPFIQAGFLFFMVENLYWLKRSGKLNLFSSLLGGMLDVKPVVSLERGKLVSVAKHRGKSSAIDSTIRLAVESSMAFGREFETWVAHANALENAHYLRDRLSEKLNQSTGDIHVVELGPTLTAHMGPGGVCLAMLPK